MTTLPDYPEQLLGQTAWLHRLTRELVPTADLAADLAQETLAAALKRPEPSRANVRTWLERIARNLAAGSTRASIRRERRERHSAQTEAEPSTADTIAEFEMHRSVVDAVEQLRDPLRTTLLLRFWEDLPPREIAKQMRVPVETVRTRLKRGLAELRGALDAQHGRRETWCGALLSLSAKPAVIATAPTNIGALLLGFLMQAKVWIVGAAVVLGLVAIMVWKSGVPEDPRATPVAHAPPADDAPVLPDPPTPVPPTNGETNTNELVAASAVRSELVAEEPEKWLRGFVTDESGVAVDAEVGLLTEAEADRYRRPDAPKVSRPETQIERIRMSLWEVSERGWMKDKASVEKMFDADLVTRTGADGSFRFPFDSVQDRSVLVVWSPVVGYRFQEVVSVETEQRILCERWPRMLGHISTVDSSSGVDAEVFTEGGRSRPGVILRFRTDSTGHFETPQVPPGSQRIRVRAIGHHDAREEFELADDVTVDIELVPLPRFHARLVDTDGQPWGRQRLKEQGWDSEELRFLLTRTDFQNQTELEREVRAYSSLTYAADPNAPHEGVIHGPVKDSEGLVLSAWSGNERLAGVVLPHLGVDEVAMDLPRPKVDSTLNVRVVLDGLVGPSPMVRLSFGRMGDLGSYGFKPISEAEGAFERFRFDVPGYLRGQSCHLFVNALGFAERIVEVPIPLEGAPTTLHVTLAPAPHALVGKVVDERNRPLVGARVKVTSEDGQAFRNRRDSVARTDERGEFRFADLARGAVRVFADYSGFASTSVLAWPSQGDPVTAQLLPGIQRKIESGAVGDAGVMLRVLDSRGAPLLDDRSYGAVHGRSTRARLSIHAATVEVWTVGAKEPSLTIPVDRLDHRPIEDR